jgi:hypothetical protein
MLMVTWGLPKDENFGKRIFLDTQFWNNEIDVGTL